METEELLIGCLRGEYATGMPAVVRVYKIGERFRINGPGRPHLCDSSVKDIEEIKREAFKIYRIWNSEFEAAVDQA